MLQEVILVNEQDEPIGVMEKMAAHEQARLHRAFSVFIFNTKGEMLLQKRSLGKYHSPGLWTNACCSHPNPGELTADAAIRRLQEELGFTTSLQKAFHFTYKAPFDNGLTEFEFDHVFTGTYEGSIHVNPEEVSDYKFVDINELEEDILQNQAAYTAWFLIAFPLLRNWMQLHNTAHA